MESSRGVSKTILLSIVLPAVLMLGVASCGSAPVPENGELPVAAPTPSLVLGPPLMESDEFWEVIERSRCASEGDVEQQAAELEEILSTLGPEKMAGFQNEFSKKNLQLYTWELWGAAYVLHDGCSDDCFEYLRSWVVAHGVEYFDAVVKNPQNLGAGLLAGSVGDSDSGEWVQYVAADTYAVATDGRNLDEDYPQILSTIAMGEPKGAEWEERDLEKLYPGLQPLE